MSSWIVGDGLSDRVRIMRIVIALSIGGGGSASAQSLIEGVTDVLWDVGTEWFCSGFSWWKLIDAVQACRRTAGWVARTAGCRTRPDLTCGVFGADLFVADTSNTS